MNSGAGSHEPADGSDREATVTGLNFATDLPVGSVLAERFRIERLLGIGGMGVVYLATDLALGVPVAVKLLRLELANRPDAFERFRQELLLARQVSSPHVVRIHDIAQDHGRWLISMDAVDGKSLENLLDTRSPLPVEEALAITRQVALGLSAAHARGVIHRDLKPSNILVDAGGQAYISDFGIARSLGTSGLTQTGAVVGTAEYLSPEQARAQPVDGRSDLYALGLLLYEMLAGQPAFSGGTQAESLTQRLVGPPAPIRRHRKDVPVWVERLLDRLLQTSPAHRLQTADAMVAAIDQRKVPRDFRPGRRTWMVATTLALLAVAAFFIWRQQPVAVPAQPPPDRLLVLQIENSTGDATLVAALAGYDEQLRQSLSTLPDLNVVDGERVDQAIAQLGLPDSQTTDVKTAALLREVPATQVLRPRLERIDSGYRFSASISRPGLPDASVIAQANPDLLAAANELTGAVARTIRPNEKYSAHLLPDKVPALAAYGQGLLELRQGRIAPALERFAAATTADPGYAAAWLAQAQAAFQAAQLDSAADAASHGLQLAPAEPLRTSLTQWKTLAAGDDLADVISRQQANIKTRPDDLDALLRLAFLQGENGDYPVAIANLNRLLARDGNDPRASFLLGKYSIMHGDLRPAVDEYLVRALVLYKRSRNVFGEAEAVNALGVGFSRLGQTADAEEQYRKAVELRRALGDRRGVASSLRNLAQLATIEGHFDEAQKQLDEARSLFEALGDRNGLSATDNDLGLLAEERGDFTKALEAFRRVLQSNQQAGDAESAAESLNNIGFANYQLGDYDNAQVFWQQALSAFTTLQDMNGIVRAQQNLGLLEIARGGWTESRRLLTTSLATAEQQQMVEEAAVSRRNLAELELMQGHLAKSLDQLDHAKTLFAQREDQRGLIDTGLLRTQVLIAANDLELATKTSSEMAAMLTGASDEQRAIVALQQAQIARLRNEPEVAQKAQADAQRLASASGVRALQLQASLTPTMPNATADAIVRLGNVPLRILWLEQSMQQDLAEGNAKAAATSYRDALSVLTSHPDSVNAFSLHWLGAQTFAKLGDQSDATAARARAADALRGLRGGLSGDLLTSFNASANVRAFEGAEHVP